MGELMEDPVILPGSGKAMDRKNIIRLKEREYVGRILSVFLLSCLEVATTYALPY